jgi:hypothetical protein
LDKGILSCYKSLKEGLGTHVPLYKLFANWGNAINNNDWEEIDNAPRRRAPTSAMDEAHMEQVKSLLMK